MLKEWGLFGLEEWSMTEKKVNKEDKKEIFSMLTEGAFQPCLPWSVLTD